MAKVLVAVMVVVKGADSAVPAAMAMRERDLKETILNEVGKVCKVEDR